MALRTLKEWLGGPALLASCAAFSAAVARDNSPERLAVCVAAADLQAFPKREDGVALARLLQGTVIEGGEVVGDFVKVRLEGFVHRSQLAAVKLAQGGAPAPASPRESRPLTDLSRASHLAVESTIIERDGTRVLQVDVGFRASDGRAVAPAGARHAGSLRVYPQRRIAGGLARGDELLARELRFVEGATRLDLPLRDLGDPAPPMVVLSARVVLAADRELVGAESERVLSAR
jgi:hypothetical protein